jgi:hypothetical protein
MPSRSGSVLQTSKTELFPVIGKATYSAARRTVISSRSSSANPGSPRSSKCEARRPPAW